MNKIKYLFALVFSIMTLGTVSAATVSIPWQDMSLEANYLKNTQEMKIAAELDGVTRVGNENYIMILSLDGSLFQQTLQYDAVSDTLSANFVNFTKKLGVNYPFSYTIRSSRNNTAILASASGTLVFRGNVAYV